MPTKVTICIFF